MIVPHKRLRLPVRAIAAGSDAPAIYLLSELDGWLFIINEATPCGKMIMDPAQMMIDDLRAQGYAPEDLVGFSSTNLEKLTQAPCSVQRGRLAPDEVALQAKLYRLGL